MIIYIYLYKKPIVIKMYCIEYNEFYAGKGKTFMCALLYSGLPKVRIMLVLLFVLVDTVKMTAVKNIISRKKHRDSVNCFFIITICNTYSNVIMHINPYIIILCEYY